MTLNLTGGSGGAGGLTQLDSQSNDPVDHHQRHPVRQPDQRRDQRQRHRHAPCSPTASPAPLAQVAIATFPDPDGLTAVSGDAFQVSQQQRHLHAGAAGHGGAGTIDPSTLEASTVDLSSQLTHLITSQSAYSASSKIITTANQMMQTLLNVIQ